MSEVINIKELNERIERESVFVDTLRTEMGKVIVGQSHLVDTLLIGLLSNGHILLEGVPGLAKTLAITTLAKAVDAGFSRIQFTPDLLPADLIGTLIYSQKNEEFVVKKGPVFANFVLADEINRSPAKVQSALLEAMQERQVTIGDQTYPLPQPFHTLPSPLLHHTPRGGRAAQKRRRLPRAALRSVHIRLDEVKHRVPVGVPQRIHGLAVACAIGGQLGLVIAGLGIVQCIHHLVGDEVVRRAVDEKHRLFAVRYLRKGARLGEAVPCA